MALLVSMTGRSLSSRLNELGIIPGRREDGHDLDVSALTFDDSSPRASANRREFVENTDDRNISAACDAGRVFAPFTQSPRPRPVERA